MGWGIRYIHLCMHFAFTPLPKVFNNLKKKTHKSQMCNTLLQFILLSTKLTFPDLSWQNVQVHSCTYIYKLTESFQELLVVGSWSLLPCRRVLVKKLRFSFLLLPSIQDITELKITLSCDRDVSSWIDGSGDHCLESSKCGLPFGSGLLRFTTRISNMLQRT